MSNASKLASLALIFCLVVAACRALPSQETHPAPRPESPKPTPLEENSSLAFIRDQNSGDQSNQFRPTATQSVGSQSVDAQTPNEMASLILHWALHEAVWGPPAACTVRQQIEIFGHRLNGFGKYVRGGQGSGKLKLILQFPAGDSMNSLFQVSDGQRFHSVEDIGGKRKRTVVDLDKVRKRLGFLTNDSLNDPVVAMYLAVGGQAEEIRKICQQYSWYDVQIGKKEEREVWIISGKLTKEPPAIRALAKTDKILFSETGLTPTDIRVYIGKSKESDDDLPFWLYRVEHRRTDSSSESQLQLVTEWAQPTRPPESALGPEFFQAQPNNEPIFEETEDYLPPPMNVAQTNLPYPRQSQPVTR